LWQGLTGINNPCPIGFRLPTEIELEAERQSWTLNTSTGAFNSILKLTNGGARYPDGGLNFVGADGRYWSSTVSTNQSRFLFFMSTNSYNNTTVRASGHSVRCIKN
jgi:hypothetical protein